MWKPEFTSTVFPIRPVTSGRLLYVDAQGSSRLVRPLVRRCYYYYHHHHHFYYYCTCSFQGMFLMRLYCFSQLFFNGAELLLASLRFWPLYIVSHLKNGVSENVSIPIYRRNGGETLTHLGPTGKLLLITEQTT